MRIIKPPNRSQIAQAPLFVEVVTGLQISDPRHSCTPSWRLGNQRVVNRCLVLHDWQPELPRCPPVSPDRIEEPRKVGRGLQPAGGASAASEASRSTRSRSAPSRKL